VPGEPEPRPILERLRAGDHDAFQELVAPHEERLRTILHLRLPGEVRAIVDVEDALQETLMRAWRGVADLQSAEPTALRAWLARIAANTAADFARRNLGAGKRDARREVELPGEGQSTSSGGLADSAPDAPRRLRRLERWRRLEAALAALSTDHREVILLARIEGLPMQAVGERMGRSAKAASTLLYRALLALRDRFGETESFELPSDPDLAAS
jgi:RNA polymerase sigma-70 factor (ECF subfamily)